MGTATYTFPMGGTSEDHLRRRSRGRLLVAALVAVVSLVALGACEPEPYTFTYVGTGRKVAVVGDSITASAETQLLAALSPYSRAVAGVEKMSMASGLDSRVRPAIATDPDVLMIELGINDAGNGWSRTTDLANLEATLAALDEATCVVWVTPSALAPSYYDANGFGTLQERIAAFKASLVKRLPAHPNQRLADFSVVQLTHPEWFSTDHLHLSVAGRRGYADFVASSVARCP